MGVRRRGPRCVLGMGMLATAVAGAAEPEPSKLLPSWFTPMLSERARGEMVSWFEPPAGKAAAGAESYAFFDNTLRFGGKVTVPHLELVVEGENVEIANLPDDASLAPPIGNLGPGALYFAHTHGLDGDPSQGEIFLRQGYLTVRDLPGVPGLSITGGRFEYSDGLETVSADPSLAWLERSRIAERLVGPFNYTAIGRSFDGGRLAFDTPDLNLTGVAFHPTDGGFEISANREISDIVVGGAAATLKRLPGVDVPIDVRTFYFYYGDHRFSDANDPPVPVKVDNRPIAVRAADREPIAIHTIGSDAVTVVALGPGKIDGLLWGLIQRGDWGEQRHEAWAFAAEAGYQLPAVWGAPWLRAGYDQSSGDDDPTDDTHHTFFQMLPTARIYAQFPFFNLMNSQDTFVQLLLKPHPRVSVRTDYHWLRLTERKDLWYAGGGATNAHVFGFSGIPANDHRSLASLVDVAVTVTILQQLSAYLYYGHAFGEGVVTQTFAGSGADYAYMELVFRY